MIKRTKFKELREKGYLNLETLRKSERKIIRKLFTALPGREPGEGYIETGEEIEEAGIINIRPLDFGGMGTVYLSIQHPNYAKTKHPFDRILVNKYRRPGIMHDKSLTERFIREAQVMMHEIDHPGVPKAVWAAEPDAYRSGENLPISIKFVHNAKSLEEVIENNLDNTLERLETAKEAIKTLAEIHELTSQKGENPILHRDIKPGNIMRVRTKKGFNTKYIDWGFASDPRGKKEAKEKSDTRLTVAGVPMGTPTYMSFQQITKGSDDYTASWEVYSLGGTLYHLLTGSPPFTGEDAMMVMGQVLSKKEIPSPHIINSDISEELSRVLIKSMAFEPEERYQTMREFYDALAPIELSKAKDTRVFLGPVQKPRKNPSSNQHTEIIPQSEQPTIIQPQENSEKGDSSDNQSQ